MKEFDEQWQIIAERMYDAPMFWCEAGWRAALEEVLKQVDQSNSDGSIIDWIKEELI